ncbi:hypothetical protein JOF40_000578 [Aeromicrobium fastidiosum]|nr:hypothetical protein [Aeromicrobium fastidiosum]
MTVARRTQATFFAGQGLSDTHGERSTSTP